MSDATTTTDADPPDEAAVETPPPKTTVTVNIDGVDHEAPPGQLVIEACSDSGTYVPRFCYHPRLTPVGMCRQCLVEIEGPRGPMMVVSCMTPVAEGQIVRTATDSVKRAQEGVLELFLANHPLDCPVCDKGGECPLQDQTLSHGPGESRYVEQKRHFEKPIPISDLVLLDRERCILCDRCTRFADEVAGDKLIHFVNRSNDTQVMTFPDEPFASYFSGNTVQICPVGALTATPYRFKARPWDLEQVESTCTTCSVGCRVVIQSSRNELVRYQGVDSDPVNWGWLCDRGRFDFEAVNSDERLGAPLVRGESGLAETSWNGALGVAAMLVREALDAGGPGAIGLARRSSRHERGRVRLGQARRRRSASTSATPRSATVCRAGRARTRSGDHRRGGRGASTIVLLGPDLKEELPVLYLRLRDAAEKRRSRILEFSPIASGLTRLAWKSVRYEPGGAPAVIERHARRSRRPRTAGEGQRRRRRRARQPRRVAGVGRRLVGRAARRVARCQGARRRSGAATSWARCRARPAPRVPTTRITTTDLSVLRAAGRGKLDLLVLLGADPINDCPDADLARRAVAGARRLIVDRHVPHRLQPPCRRRARRRGVRREVGYHDEHRRSGDDGRPEDHARRHCPPRLDDRRRAGDRARPRPRVRIGPRRHRCHRRRGPRLRGHHRGRAGERTATASSRRCRRSTLPEITATARERNTYDYRLVVSRKLYDNAVGTVRSPSLAPLAPGAAAHLHPLDFDQTGVAAGADVRIVERAGLGRAPARCRPGGAARHGVGSVQPDRRRHRATSSTRRCRSPTCGSSGCESRRAAGGRSAARRRVAVDPARDRAGQGRRRVRASALVATMLMVWFERKVIAGMQNRIGPNKAGPFGILQTLADGIKLFFKEDLLPDRADRCVFRLAPLLAVVPAFLVWTRHPARRRLPRRQRRARHMVRPRDHAVQLADPPIGILLVLALSSIAVYGDHARRLVERVEVPAARLRSGVGPDGLLRSGARAQPGRRPAVLGHAQHGRHRGRAGRASSTGTSSPPASCRSSCS